MEQFAFFLTDYAWILWIALILLFGVIEIFTLDMVFLMLALGGVGGLLTSLSPAPLWLQIVVAAVLALGLTLTLRPPLLRRLKRGADEARSNIDALIGMAGTVVLPLSPGPGQVKLANGETWTARPEPSHSPVPVGRAVRVVRIDGATAVVIPEERKS